ncbi:uncharacterized protein (TIGR02001 family) [Acinetobacter calcoaceticus]|uniref:Uncharacterized protein (TIGR02001 family) n=1 Tax=Acinetobacter calcoaceticus TaxID=471 RepID=A0A4R1Y1W4_ACICA|nr:uncharacterized protein (TIGR02001 family) [Acinetobacter calcoaceticus]
MKMKKSLCLLAVLSTVSTLTLAADEKQWPFPGEVTGNIAVLSSYDLRGITNTPENDKVTMQAGLEYGHPSGFYLGYWGSTLGYSLTKFDDVTEEYSGRKSFENDFNIGYRGKINDDWGYTVGGTYYMYYESDAKSDYFETLLGVNYQKLAITAQTATKDVDTANKGDTYFLATYAHELPRDFTANIGLGAYYYGDSDKYLKTTETFNFRHLTLGVSHPLGDTGALMNLDFIVGGYDRMNEKQKNKVALGLKYNF